MKKRVLKAGVQAALLGASLFARPQALGALSVRLMAALGARVARARGVRPVTTVAELGPAWQRAFPSAKQVPIVGGDERTVLAQIRTPCPLRGTGDVAACYRMMAYDRAFLERAGGQFVVLRSQAEPGRTYCEVAMRRAGESTDDLVPAHLRAEDAAGGAVGASPS